MEGTQMHPIYRAVCHVFILQAFTKLLKSLALGISDSPWVQSPGLILANLSRNYPPVQGNAIFQPKRWVINRITFDEKLFTMKLHIIDYLI